ncbi:tRNA (guanine-N(7)-)-methyltransferase non-catalytic subunit wdr4 [Austrofundulus limnaeus]|uniref:tRNA (Guanine-N(7)-)-methyltransferase non-catalytic subunit wdr4 n=1 Tax=Austrofundulus limnaeus TaxID=52670 RepID=A0A2I4D6R9_AUSLI|nr:PREDICTED: tRNA (guanine-N(7)-)-methyltransferase non-catalytic subunit WDR4 [Austrofundulus limnaeus]
MTMMGFCGAWLILSCDKKLMAFHRKESREPFVFDCSCSEKNPKSLKKDNSSDGGPSEETGSDKVISFVVSPSEKLVALTDDSKRLILFECEPLWCCISIRWVVRRCTSLVFNPAEDELLVADKSGDVYSFSVVEPQREGELKMGHLSMLLAVTMSPDDNYIITADLDEKIRVSHHRSPYNIQSFCLGHHQFVSALQIPSNHSHWLLSGSGDGTVKLWDYKSGCCLQSWDLRLFDENPSSDPDKEKNMAVCRLTSSYDGCHVAVLCERVSTVYFFTLNQESEKKLVPHSRLHLPHCPLDVNFDMKGRLWLLSDSSDAPLEMYTLRQNSWECETENFELSRVTEALRPHWDTMEASTRANNHFEHLYKVSFDNVSVYLQKKQQRLDEQQLKRTKSQKANGNKRPKKELSSAKIQSSA